MARDCGSPRRRAILNQKMNSVSSVFSIHSNTSDRMSSYLIDFLLYFVVLAVVDALLFRAVVFVFGEFVHCG